MAVTDVLRSRSKTKSPPAGNASILESMQRFWRTSYAGDYLGLSVLLAAYLLLKLTDEPFHKMFRLDDPRIQFPHAEIQRVPVFMLFTYALAVPLATLLLWTLILSTSLRKTHIAVLGLLTSVLLTCFLTDILKDAIGRPRPDLLARCKPDPTTTPLHKLVTIAVCTETEHHLLHDGWRSCPSGHSSFSFAGLGYLAMFFASQTGGLRPRASLATVLLCLAPLVGAGLVAISRLEDYRHDVFDVVAGSSLGLLVAWATWRRYWPSLLESGCGEPYESGEGKAGGSSGGGFRRVRDEEEGEGMRGRFGGVDEGEVER